MSRRLPSASARLQNVRKPQGAVQAQSYECEPPCPPLRKTKRFEKSGRSRALQSLSSSWMSSSQAPQPRGDPSARSGHEGGSK